MAVSGTVSVLQSALWPQGDARDPLGIWGGRLGLTGDASGGGLEALFIVPQARKSSYIYTCYAANLAVITGVPNTALNGALRLFTNWPPADPLVGVRPFNTNNIAIIQVDTNLFDPEGGARQGQLLQPNDRYLLLYEPRPSVAGDMQIAQMTLAVNTDLATYSFELYGYFWDRAALDAPGGLRHPGSN